MASGIILVNKPRGITSHDVVDRVRAITGIRRVGHAGTLDPLAEGLLIILVGDATKRQAEFMGGEKEYIAVMRLGATSDTDDAEGNVREVGPPRGGPTSKHEIEEVLKRFVGAIEQVPPTYSAVKIRGRKAYELARKGTQPTLPPRRVVIKAITLLTYAWPKVKLRIVCSPGTYIRALARDIGISLGVGAYLETLQRTRSGSFLLNDAVALDDLTTANWKRYLAKA